MMRPRKYGFKHGVGVDRVADNRPAGLATALIQHGLQKLDEIARAEGDHLELSTLAVTFAPAEGHGKAPGDIDMCIEVQGTEPWAEQ